MEEVLSEYFNAPKISVIHHTTEEKIEQFRTGIKDGEYGQGVYFTPHPLPGKIRNMSDFLEKREYTCLCELKLTDYKVGVCVGYNNSKDIMYIFYKGDPALKQKKILVNKPLKVQADLDILIVPSEQCAEFKIIRKEIENKERDFSASHHTQYVVDNTALDCIQIVETVKTESLFEPVAPVAPTKSEK
eukprot:TRINITY_DN5442_c0_g1_i1.p1 TRINITY_DN5442_c0_g1~~TRINITY_DN5442_c0_g1_i1.p1  ORF type:complete len:188 (+),score=20.72 TRINITY_DN5442_c0_g1_i1:750-1313(+)